VALLEVKSGISAKEWLWGKSFLSLAKAYTELHRFADAFSFGGKLKKRMTDELDEALNDLARVKVAIARRIKAEREQKKDE
jgi:predicted negative regulator of RcsB-dependent stress response